MKIQSIITTISFLVLTTALSAQVKQYIEMNGISKTTPAASVCQYGDVILSVTGPGVDADWSWTGPNGFSATGKAVDLLSFRQTQAGVYTASVVLKGKVQNYDFELTALASDFVDWKNDIVIINGDRLKLFAPVTGTDYSYSWSTGGTKSFVIIDPTVTTEYKVTVTSDFGCQGIDKITVHVVEDKAQIIETTIEVCEDQIEYLSGPSNYDTYAWHTTGNASRDIYYHATDIDEKLILEATDANGVSFFYIYYLNLITCNGQPTTENPLEILSPINRSRQEFKVSVYPNPSTDIVNIDFDQPSEVENSIQLVDMNGQLVYENNNADQKQSINVTDLAAGTYVICVSNQYERQMQQVIVSH